MVDEVFARMRKRVIREHKHSIVRSAKNGHKSRGRGLVLVKFTKSGQVHVSYRTLESLKLQHDYAGLGDGDHAGTLIERISSYSPDSEIPVMVTDGETHHFSFGVRQ